MILLKSGLITTQPIPKKNAARAYQFTKNRFCQCFGKVDIVDLTPETILKLLNDLTHNNTPCSKRVRFAQPIRTAPIFGN